MPHDFPFAFIEVILFTSRKGPVVKAKAGPQIKVFIADNTIFDTIPVKKEVKAVVNGLYIVSVRGIRGQLEKPVKKKRLRFLSKLFGEK